MSITAIYHKSSFRSISLSALEQLLNRDCALFTGVGDTVCECVCWGEGVLSVAQLIAFESGKTGDRKYSIPCLLANHTSNWMARGMTLVPHTIPTLNF
jgi:hypothetical protein